MDPLRVIKHYSGCKLNPKHSKLDSLKLGVVWKFIKNVNLSGAHDSLVDAKAQSDIILHPSFAPYLNKTQSIVPIDEIFTETEVREMKKKMEPNHPVHDPWVEITEDADIKWEPTRTDSYTGSEGGNASSCEECRFYCSYLLIHGSANLLSASCKAD